MTRELPKCPCECGCANRTASGNRCTICGPGPCRRLGDCADALNTVERAYGRLEERADALEDALAWALRNKGGECPADDPAGYVKAVETLIADLDGRLRPGMSR